MADIYLNIIASAKSFSDAQKLAREEMTKTEQKVKDSNKKMQTGFENIGKTLKMVAAQLGIAFGAMQVINYIRKMGTELMIFEKTMANVLTQLTDVEKKKFGAALKEGSLEVMAKYGLSVQDVNAALFDAISSGIKAGDAIKFVDEAAKLSVAGMTSLNTVTNAATAVINAYHLSISELEKITSALFTTQKYGVTTVEELTREFGTVIPIAHAAGVSYQEVLAALALLTKQGINTAESVTALRATLTAIASPSNEAKKIFEDLGIQTGLVALKQNGLGKTLYQVAKASDTNADVLTELIPNVRALTAVSALGTEALKEYDFILKDINTDYGEGSSLAKAYEEQHKTTEQTFKRLTATIRKLWIESDALNTSKKALTATADALATDLNKDKGLVETYLKIQKITAELVAGGGPLIFFLRQLLKEDEDLADGIELLTEEEKKLDIAQQKILITQRQITLATGGETEERLKLIKAERELGGEMEERLRLMEAEKAAIEEQKKGIVTINSLKKELADLITLKNSINIQDEKTIKNINSQIIALQNQIKEIENLGAILETVKIKPFEFEDIEIGTELFGFEPEETISSIEQIINDADAILNAWVDKRYEGEDQAIQDSIRLAEEEKQRKEELIYEFADTAMALTDLIYANQQASMDKELAAAEGNEKAQEEIRKKYAKKGQSVAIGQAFISGALAILKIAEKWAGTPVQIALTALQVIQTALQIATIKAQKFSKGVLDLQGPGTTTSDSIPAKLSKHETVMTAKETQEFYPYLKAMKEGKFPKLQFELMSDFVKMKSITNNNLNYDNSKEIRELRNIQELLKEKSELEFIQAGQRVIKKGNITTRININ